MYKQQILKRPCAPDLNYLQNTTLDDMYTDVVIHTDRAERPFSEEIVDRQEIYGVYTEIPPKSIPLKEIKDIFYPNKDTEGEYPRSILVIGRPGIGKTVLTEKIIRDWAKENDDYYRNKIAFVFKFRCLNADELKNITLKTFLRLGTKNLSREYFEQIYKEISNDPHQAIFILDGLDEFHGDPINYIEQSQNTLNDRNNTMSAINFCIKLILGDLMKGATVVTTSRPTAEDFYSKLHFKRKVEINGFTPDKIEEYVRRFCKNTKKSYLAPQILRHIKSSSELSNLCYIPVNCFVVCVTLSECLCDSRSTLPTTLTEFYERAAMHFDKYHHRNSKTKEILSKLQKVAFFGIVNDELVFAAESFDEQMKKSGFLHCLSNPLFPLRTQFCFIHLTIQEFLAAKYLTETLATAELKKFISDHVRSGKWHLVLQFVAGLVGKRIRMRKEYKNCLLAFAKSIDVKDGTVWVRRYSHNAFIMKCLKEVDNEDIVKDVLEITRTSGEVNIHVDGRHTVSPDECAEVTFSAKIMKNLVNFSGYDLKETVFEEVLEFLQKRCVNSLKLCWGIFTGDDKPEDKVKRTLSTLSLATTGCTIKHKHSKLTGLQISFNRRISLVDLSSMYEDLVTGRVYSQLEYLALNDCGISSRQIKILCNFFNKDHCTKLRVLNLGGNPIGDEVASVLCHTLVNGLRGLTSLEISNCSLTHRCVHSLCKALQDEHCQLTDLDLGNNDIGDKGARDLFENGLTNEHCKLTKLNLRYCWLEKKCIRSLCKALQDERCQLTDVTLARNAIGDEYVGELFENGLTNEHCKLTKLNLWYCSLTNQCIPSLCNALQDERCQVTDVDLTGNVIGDEGARELFENVLTNEHCKLKRLSLSICSLTDQCIPSLCEALQDERCMLTELGLICNKDITNNGKKWLRDIQNSCKFRDLKIVL